MGSQVERETGRPVRIESTESNQNLAICHLQEQSPLFTLLPREIRDLIWAFATAPYEDLDHPYAENEFYYRPGHVARWKTETQLLLTCRRIWLEANHWPMLQAEQCFWYYREAPDRRDRHWMERLTPNNRRNLGTIHMFVQMYAIEGLSSSTGALRRHLFDNTVDQTADFMPRAVIATVRHTDWWFWENDTPLRFQDSWLQALLDSPDLRSTQTLKVELETLDYKVTQLLPIIQRLEGLQSREYQTHMIDGKAVSTKFVPSNKKEEYDWSGPVDIDNTRYAPYEDKAKLNYHVITLTWKLRFPELPHAHVPTLRRAPRMPLESRFSAQPSAALLMDKNLRTSLQERVSPARFPLFSRPLRRNDRKKLAAGLWPARKQWAMDLLQEALHVRMSSVCNAEMQEIIRRAMFEKAMHSFARGRWEAKWKREGSLLRFAE